MNFLKKISQLIDALNEKTGLFAAWLSTLMVLTVVYDVIMRYGFKKGNIAVQEMEWHLFAVVFLIGAAYSLKKDAHVRVDILYTKFSTKKKAWVDLLGTFIFLIPFSIMIIYSCRGFIESSWAVHEISPDPGGLPARYILKAVIPAGFVLLILQGISQAIKNLLIIVGKENKVAQ
ncbi:MAG: TRAP transporter small permease subunit [Deltaproteobacteria bacterium]|nr:TRAP transporter small permease subunit [Candidatus Tharpella sp.]